jgi:hypothetical protein
MQDTIIIEGELTERHHKGHQPHAFDVPEGATRISCRFSYVPERATGALFDNLLTLSLFGPDGPRGVRHNCCPELDFTIDVNEATPGYAPGPIEPGRWSVVIDGFRVLGPEPIRYRFEIDCDSAPLAPAILRPAAVVADRGTGWYRGDLHAHSDHSDASWTIKDWAAWARRRKLDFAVLSDHNTISGHREALTLAGDDLLVIGGNELTTHYGHALTVGQHDWQEWRADSWPGVTMPAIAEEVMGKDALYVIAHPESPGDPACTGCHWDFADMRPGNAKIVEIWNGGEWSGYNEEGLTLFRNWLDLGHRLIATAGTDIHGASDDKPLMGFNHVRADALSRNAILAAIARGENVLSSGPLLILAAQDALENVTPMGGICAAPERASLRWRGAEGGLTLRLIASGGEILFERAVEESGDRNVPVSAGNRWMMAELRDAAGLVHAVTNPVFLGPSHQ